jgi:aminopeptidase
MRNVLFAAAVVACLSLPAAHAEPDYDAVARSVVTQSAGVKPGDVVYIQGSEAELGVLKALVTATIAAGGLPITTIDLPTANKAGYMAAPMAYLSQAPKADLALLEIADVYIVATGTEDPTLFADVPEDRLHALREASDPVSEGFAKGHFRFVALGQTGGIPSAAYAQSQHADFGAMRAMFWSALAVPPETIAARGAAVTSKMTAGARVRVTSSAGTNLRFTLADAPSHVSTGRASDNAPAEGPAQAFLPAGDFYACIAPASASGTLVAPFMTFRGTPVTNLRMVFANGAATTITADTGADEVKGYFASAGAPSAVLSLINIGLNPESRLLEGSQYRSWEMSGVVTAFLGDNRWAGCAHEAEGGFSAHVDGATVTAGRATVVRAGALATN